MYFQKDHVQSFKDKVIQKCTTVKAPFGSLSAKMDSKPSEIPGPGAYQDYKTVFTSKQQANWQDSPKVCFGTTLSTNQEPDLGQTPGPGAYWLETTTIQPAKKVKLKKHLSSALHKSQIMRNKTVQF